MTSDAPRLLLTEPRDLVALVPYRLGFVPTDSLALVGVRGPHGHIGLVVRVDLSDVLAGGEDCLAAITAHLADDGARLAVAVLYDDSCEGWTPGWLPVLEDLLADHGIDLVDCWQVGERRYRSLLCVGRGCCPTAGWPVSDLQSAAVAAQMVALGVSPARTRAGLLPDLTPAPVAVRRRVAARVRRAPAPLDPAGRLAGLHAWLRVLGAPTLAEERDLAGALAALGDPLVRDAVVLTCTPDGRRPAEELVLTGGTGPGGEALRELFGAGAAGTAPTPDRRLLADALAALTVLARHAQGTRRADPLAVMAWAWWWQGDGARGQDAAELALRSRRDHVLATLVRSALRRGTPPAWVRAERRRALRAVPPLPE